MGRVALALVLLVGCGKQLNPAWCADHDDPVCPDASLLGDPGDADGPDRPPAMCARDEECPGTALCLPEGTCATPEASLFVSVAGSGTECKVGVPCSLAAAIDQATEARKILLLAPGTYADSIAINHPARIFGRGATIQAGAAGATITVTNGVAVELRDLTVRGAVRAAGISCTSGELHLERVAVRGNQQGITSGCQLSVVRSVISDNLDGAIAITAGAIDVRNNFIVRNGNPMLARSANVTIAAGVTGAFAFNTVAYNDSKPNSTPGVDCQASDLAVAGNLITDNTTRGKFNGAAQVTGSCDFSGSYTAPGLGGNDLRWVEVETLDFHLTSGSTAALDVAGLSCDGLVDFDGEPRPSGSSCDYGADELVR